MALTANEWKLLTEFALVTREVEIGCDECLAQAGAFAENELAGKEVREAMRLVQQHLAVCPECREEYEALLAALRVQAE